MQPLNFLQYRLLIDLGPGSRIPSIPVYDTIMGFDFFISVHACQYKVSRNRSITSVGLGLINQTQALRTSPISRRLSLVLLQPEAVLGNCNSTLFLPRYKDFELAAVSHTRRLRHSERE